MVSMMSLVLPTLLAAVIVFVVSSVIHMLSPWHKNDYPAVPNEDAFRNAVRPLNIPPGDYLVPRPPTPAAMKDPQWVAKLKEGPKMILTVMNPADFSMAKPLVGWFIFCIIVGGLAGHVACATLPAGSSYKLVFHTVGLVAFAGYALGAVPISIWYGRAWSTTFKALVDGAIYGMLTAGTFGWLWPK